MNSSRPLPRARRRGSSCWAVGPAGRHYGHGGCGHQETPQKPGPDHHGATANPAGSPANYSSIARRRRRSRGSSSSFSWLDFSIPPRVDSTIVHTTETRSTSLHVASRTSVERVAVSTRKLERQPDALPGLGAAHLCESLADVAVRQGPPVPYRLRLLERARRDVGVEGSLRPGGGPGRRAASRPFRGASTNPGSPARSSPAATSPACRAAPRRPPPASNRTSIRPRSRAPSARSPRSARLDGRVEPRRARPTPHRAGAGGCGSGPAGDLRLEVGDELGRGGLRDADAGGDGRAPPKDSQLVVVRARGRPS